MSSQGESVPAPEQRSVIEYLESRAHDLAGDGAQIERGAIAHDRILTLEITPQNRRARAVSVLAEQFLVVLLGRNGGRWELGYSDDDVRVAVDLLAAAIAGHVVQRSALGRSRVTATLADGTAVSDTGYIGCLTFLLPLPGWQRWGHLTIYEPYDRGGWGSVTWWSSVSRQHLETRSRRRTGSAPGRRCVRCDGQTSHQWACCPTRPCARRSVWKIAECAVEDGLGDWICAASRSVDV